MDGLSPANRHGMQIGLALPIAENDATRQTPRFAEIRALAMQVEAAGFDSIWVYDHLMFRFPDTPTTGIWEAWTSLAALAAVTTQVQLGTLVLCTGFRNPALVAKMAATLDEISAGRLILGLGAGWQQPEYAAFGFPFDHRVDRFAEALQIIVPLLHDGHVDVAGQYSKACNAELRPRGPRPSGPPILIGASKPRMLRLTARYANSWNTCWLGQPTALPARRAAMEVACRAEGRDPTTLEVTVGVSITPRGTTQPDDPAPRSDENPCRVRRGGRCRPAYLCRDESWPCNLCVEFSDDRDVHVDERCLAALPYAGRAHMIKEP